MQPDIENPDLKPDSQTPVVSGGRIYGIGGQLQELDPQDGLKTTAIITDDAFAGYGCLVASEQRLLVSSEDGKLLLLTTEERPSRIRSRLKLSESRTQILSHPAVVEFSLYLRIENQLGKLSLKTASESAVILVRTAATSPLPDPAGGHKISWGQCRPK